MLGAASRAGFIVPSGIATDDTTKEYFGALVTSSRLRSLYDFQTGPGLFADIGHARFKFCLLTVGVGTNAPDMVFFARDVAELGDAARHFALSSEDFSALNPNTRTCPTFRSRRDADINLMLYRRVGVLWREGTPDGNPWKLRFMVMLHMANDSALFRTRAQLEFAGAREIGNRFELQHEMFLPLAEAKMVHHFDHRFGDYDDRPEGSKNTSLPDVPLEKLRNPAYSPRARYWVHADEVRSRLEDKWARAWLLGWRDICRSFDERTVIASLIPAVGVGHKFPLLFAQRVPPEIALLYANLCSLALDYAARQKIGGASLTYFLLKQFPVLSPTTYDPLAPWATNIPVGDWLLSRVLELTYTAWDLEPFARDVGYGGPPFRWDPARRFLLRAELDAAFFQLYGLSRDDTAYVMETFPIVRKKDEKAHGEYRTKRVILEIYDAMAEAARTGRAYETRLDPPPADPRVAHPDTRKGAR